MTTTIEELAGTEWEGTGELWLDPLGNEASKYPCTMRVTADGARYTWEHDGKTHEGAYVLRGDGAWWTDSFHQADGGDCALVKDAWGIFTLYSTYPAPAGPPWGWRTTLSQRPSGKLVLQMTNITPWGETGRAVRMVFTNRA